MLYNQTLRSSELSPCHSSAMFGLCLLHPMFEMQRKGTMISMLGEGGYGLKSSPKSLVNHLKRKLQNPDEKYPLIPVLNIYKWEPEVLVLKYNDLCGIASDDEECFFFCPPPGPSGKGMSRVTPEGSWGITGNGNKGQETDLTKWAQNNLVYHRDSQTTGRAGTDWAMQEYTIESDESFYLYHIHKKRGNKRKKKADSVSNEPEYSSSMSTSIVPEASVDMTVDHETPTPSSEIDVPGCGIFSPQNGKTSALESLSSAAYTFTHSDKAWVIKDSEINQMQIAEQFPCSPDSSFDGYSQDLELACWQYPQDAMDRPLFYGSLDTEFPHHYQYPQHVVDQPPNVYSPQNQCLHQDGLVQLSNYGSADLFPPDLRYLQNVYAQRCGYELATSYLALGISMLNMPLISYLTTNSPNLPSPQYQYLLGGFAQLFHCAMAILLSPPQRQPVLPMQEIVPSIYNQFSDNSGSNSQMDNCGEVTAWIACLSQGHGTPEVNSEECLQPSVDSPIATPPQTLNPFIDEQLQMHDQQAEFLLSDGFRRDNSDAIFIAQQVTQDSAAGSSGFNYLDFLTSLTNLPGESSSSEISSLIGGDMTGNCGLNLPNHQIT